MNPVKKNEEVMGKSQQPPVELEREMLDVVDADKKHVRRSAREIAEIASAIAKSYARRAALTKPVGQAHRV